MVKRQRFHQVWINFVDCISSDGLLVLFYDDLQWYVKTKKFRASCSIRADPSSLELLGAILTHPGAKNFVFIGAYRPVPEDRLDPLFCFLQSVSAKEEVEASLKELD